MRGGVTDVHLLVVQSSLSRQSGDDRIRQMQAKCMVQFHPGYVNLPKILRWMSQGKIAM